MTQHGGSSPAEQDPGILLVLVGEGWGKSAAAVGYLGRAWAHGWHCCAVQFLKGAAWNVAERALASHLDVQWHTFDQGMAWGSGRTQDPVALGQRAWRVAADRISSGQYELVVLDELGNALTADWLSQEVVLAGLRDRHPATNVIVTGRQVPAEICQLADTVTRFVRERHQGQQGILR